MADTVIFRGSYIRKFEMVNNPNERHIKIEMTSDWTDVTREQMHWGEVGDEVGGCDLIGALAASNIVLTPAGRPLKDHEIKFAANVVGGFNLVPLKDGEGEITGRELRYWIKTTAPDAAQWLEAYCNAIGRGMGQLKVSYVKQAELDLDPATQEDPQQQLATQ